MANHYFSLRIHLKRFFVFLVVCCGVFSFVSAQEIAVKPKPSIAFGLSALKFNGDVGKESENGFLKDIKTGYFLTIEQRFGKVFGLAVSGTYGKLTGNDNSAASKRNFQTSIVQGELLLTANFDKIFQKEPAAIPYLHAGIGFMTFDPHGDLKNNISDYYYWSDGTLRDRIQNAANLKTARVLKRDYEYETQLKDSLVQYKRNTLTVPLGLGFNFQLTSRLMFLTGVKYVICMSDYLDNYKNGGNDSYFQANFGLHLLLQKKVKKDEVDFSGIDHEDSDGDGIEDAKDMCMGTPKDVKTDETGCPLDTDMDGVADYLDKEPNSKPDAIVNAEGVTVNEEELAQQQLTKKNPYRDTTIKSVSVKTITSNDAVGDYFKNMYANVPATQNTGSAVTNTSPAVAQTQSKSTDTPAAGTPDSMNSTSATTTQSTIPADYQSVDYNKDNKITADEIARTIDEFFEGQNDFNAEKINRLIDYFFEQ